MPQEKLPVEHVSMDARLMKSDLDAILRWYFENFLNKNVSSIAYTVSSQDLYRVDLRCIDKDVTPPTRTVEQINQAVKPGNIVID